MPPIIRSRGIKMLYNRIKIIIFYSYTLYFKICEYNPHAVYGTLSKEPQCARFRRVFTCSPIVLLRIKQCTLPSSVRSILIPHCDKDETGQNTLCDRYLNNRRTGKDATKPRTLGLLGHSITIQGGVNLVL